MLNRLFLDLKDIVVILNMLMKSLT